MGGEFGAAVRERVRRARLAWEEAVGGGDVFEIAVARGELDEALWVAREHGVETGPGGGGRSADGVADEGLDE